MGTRISRFCDRHAAKGDDSIPGTQRGPFLGRMVDMCDGCYDELAGALLELLEDRGVGVDGAPVRRPAAGGRPPGAKAAADGMFPCIVCEEPHTGGGMASHLKRIHGGTGLAQFYGTDCPICGKGGTNAGTHIGRSHPEANGYGVVGAFEFAKAAGDPHGIVARQTAAARVRG